MNDLAYNRQFVSVASLTVNGAAGDKVILTPFTPIVVTRWGMIWTTALDTGQLVAALDYRPTAGSDSGRVDGSTSSGIDTAGGSITVLAAASVAGTGRFHNVKQAVAGVFGGAMELNPGEQAVWELVSETAGAGALIPWIEYAILPFQANDTRVSARLTVA